MGQMELKRSLHVIAIFCHFRCRVSSPLETAMERAFVAAIEARNRDNRHGLYLGIQNGWTFDEFPPLPVDGLAIGREVTVGIYRVDFLLLGTDNRRFHRRVVCECDGHAFHDARPSQIRADRARDRFMELRDFRVLRYSGDEIRGNADRCAAEAIRLATGSAGL